MSPQTPTGLEVREGEPAAILTPSTASEEVAPQSSQPSSSQPEKQDKKQSKAAKKSSKQKCSKKHTHCKSLKKKVRFSDKDRAQSDSETDSSSDSSDSDQDPEPSTKHRRNSKRGSSDQITLKQIQLKVADKSSRSSRDKVSVSGSSDESSGDSSDEDSKKSVSKSDKKVLAQIESISKQVAQISLQMTQQQQQGQLSNAGLTDPSTSGLAGLEASAAASVQQQLLALQNLGLGGGAAATPKSLSNSLAARRRASRQSSNAINSDEAAIAAQIKAQDQKSGRSGEGLLDFKRVDHVWDNSIHDYRLQDTAPPKPNESYNGYVFHVRRHFDWEGKYLTTYVDVKSKALRECLQEIIGDVKGLSLVDDVPKLDPNLLFLYLKEFRQYMKVLKKSQPTSKDKHERKKQAKHIETARKHLKVLVKYLDKDYADIKKSLYPMLENGLITFDLLWALWKPNTLAYTTTYGSPDEPRVFKVDVAEKHKNMMKGVYYYIEGKYFEYDGKQFGYGSTAEEVSEFRGARKITSLPVYPLEYHKNEGAMRKQLIERGKKFVSLAGVQYKSHQGMAYIKVKKQIKKHNVNGRIMIDAHVHRRINPNYPVSTVRPKEHELVTIDEDSSDEEESGCCGSDGEKAVKMVTRAITNNRSGKTYTFQMPKDELAEDPTRDSEVLQSIDKKEDGAESNNDEESGEKDETFEFTDDDYLIASSVVLGFAFGEKMWLEFTVSGVKDIQWNEKAWDSLVLPDDTKSIVKALVKTHKYKASESIDDVIQGKGKGLVAVLHGPPGTGKTLTAEGISELLKCPLYMVSAGELGTDSRYLEIELQRILDICHAWGAILLLDEADIFLEKRNMHDIHRNAMVSIFLRQLEYFQGILFLTTNRVETFDDAFQSRIHIALRYGKLDPRAKKAIFRIFIERVATMERVTAIDKAQTGEVSIDERFTDSDLNKLARYDLNGREIKNTVGTAQALAINKGEKLAMTHVMEVLRVQMSFDRDLKGGPGHEEAMRGYM